MSDFNFIQVIKHLPNGQVRVYKIVEEDSHLGTKDDPLTTIVIDGYEDTGRIINNDLWPEKVQPNEPPH